MKLSSRIISYCAILIAISILLRKFLTIPLPIGILNFGGFPIILAGLMLGPVAGGITGALSDIIGATLAPHGPYIPFFTITSALTGIIPPLAMRIFSKNASNSFGIILISISIAQIITKIFMIPFIMEFCFGIPYQIYIFKSLAVEVVHIPIYAFFAHAILKSLNRRIE